MACSLLISALVGRCDLIHAEMHVRFPAYRRYKENLIAANDAMMALMIGARLGQHSLSTSPASCDALLPQLYGGIPGIERVNRTAADAADLLGTSEQHLASMGIPYALSTHGAFVGSVIEMLREDGKDPSNGEWEIPWSPDPYTLDLALVNEYFEERAGNSLPAPLLSLFHLSRKIRNRIIHGAGTPGSHLLSDYRQLPLDVRERWEAISGRPLTVESSKLRLGEGELIAVLAFSRGLAHSINEALEGALGRNRWAAIMIADYRNQFPQRFGERHMRERRVKGFARSLYGPLHLSDEEIEAELPA
jgi:hypothetical protein